MQKAYDYLIIGAGIIGLSIARAIKAKTPNVSILILDKEDDCAAHASGRNSGVLHTGFYYTADSLKARFTIEGNRRMKDYCRTKNITINECGKLVVAQNENELNQLYELECRGHRNGSNVSIISQEKASELEPNIKTFQKALYSPDTASVDPKVVCKSLKEDLKNHSVDFSFNTRYVRHQGNTISTTQGDFSAKKSLIAVAFTLIKSHKTLAWGRNTQ